MTMVTGPSPEIVGGVQMYERAPLIDDPLYWVKFLGDALTYRYINTRIYDDYYRGDHRLPTGPTRATHVEYRRLLRESRSNWAELIIDAVDERLRVIGFRFAGADGADLDIWRQLWQANNLDARSDEVHVESLVWGYAYAIVWPNAAGDVQITAEHPSEVVAYAPAGNRHAITMALKRWCDDWGYWHANLYTPDAIYKYTSAERSSSNTMPPGTWMTRELSDEPWPLPNPFGVVPVVEFANNPRMLTGGRSEIAGGQIDMMDRINETVFNRMLAAQFAAFSQKWVTGMEIPRDEAGNPIEPFRTAVDRLWMTENPDAKFGEFTEASLTNYIGAAEADIQQLAAISRTPAHYLLPHGPLPSGEALKAAETGLVAKVRRRQRFFGESWEEMLRLALLMQGDPRAADVSCETLWADPESRSDAQTADALVKLAQIGVPAEMLWELSGFFSPQQMSRMQQQRADEALLFGMPQLSPTPVPPVMPAPIVKGGQ
jgi:Phage portal protein, SPP1 Gp6-like